MLPTRCCLAAYGANSSLDTEPFRPAALTEHALSRILLAYGAQVSVGDSDGRCGVDSQRLRRAHRDYRTGCRDGEFTLAHRRAHRNGATAAVSHA